MDYWSIGIAIAACALFAACAFIFFPRVLYRLGRLSEKDAERDVRSNRNIVLILLQAIGLWIAILLGFVWLCGIVTGLIIIALGLLVWGGSYAYQFAGPFIVDTAKSIHADGSLPFYIAGLVGFALLFVSMRYKNPVVGALGAGLIAAGFSHWVGAIQFPK